MTSLRLLLVFTAACGAGPLATGVRPDVPTGAAAATDARLAALARPIVDAYQDGAPTLSPDGKHVVFDSNREGLWQLYVADYDHPEAPARRLVTTRERALWPSFDPDGKIVYFLGDHGGDEHWSIFQVGLDGSGLIQVTPPDPKRSYYLVGFAPQATGGPHLIYVAWDPRGTKEQIYSRPVSGGAPELLYQYDGWTYDVSGDGRHLLLTPMGARLSNAVIYRLDLPGNHLVRFYPPAGRKETVNTARYSPDGKTVYVATDGGAEGCFVLALDVTTGKERGRFAETHPATAMISSLSPSADGSRLGLVMSAGDHSFVRVLDARTLAPVSEAALPLGSAERVFLTDSVASLSADGSRLAVAWSTADAPGDLYGVDPATGAATPLRREVRPGLEHLASIDTRLERVRSFDGTAVPINVYRRRAAAPKGPAIVLVHGGPMFNSPVRWNPWVRFYLSLGYEVVEPNIRGSTGFGRAYEMADNGPKRLDAVKDLAAVGEWAGKQPWCNGQVVVEGASYGGYMVLMALTHQPRLWSAGVMLRGLSNLRTFLAKANAVTAGLIRTEFGSDDPALLDELSPIRYAGRIAAPLFVEAGAQDIRTPREESDQIVAALRARRAPVEYMLVTDEGHGLDKEANVVAFLARSARFLAKALAWHAP